MYGWRGRIGLMLPYDNAVIEPEFARTLPHGVSSHVIRMTKTDREELAEESISMAAGMAHLKANVVLHACNASSFMQGRRWHDAFLARLQKAAGAPSETASSAMIKLLRHRRVERVMLVTPYPQWLLEPLREFVNDSGIRAAGAVGLGLEPVEINALGPEQCYRFVLDNDMPQADAIFILATNFRTLEVLARLERELGKPVMSSNQALMWTALQHLRVAPEPPPTQELAAWPLDTA